MNMKFVKAGEKKRIISELNERFGIKKLNYILIETGRQKIRGFSGSMTKDEIRDLAEIANIEIIGAYLLKRESRLRLSLDGTMILKDQIDKNVISINDEELDLWLHGKNLEIIKKNETYIVSSGDDFIGCGISDGKKIINHVPKERRIRSS